MNNKVTIGRAPECDIVVDQSYGRVSNEHATLEIQDGQLIFKDHSSNGTMINGRLIHQSSIAIQNGDKIMLADAYELSWANILRLFPALQRKTERFDGSQIESGERKTEMFNPADIESSHGDSVNGTRQHTISENKTVGQLNDYTQLEVDEYLERFNFGAFLSTWFWSLCNRIYWPLIIIPISLIPYLGQIASLFLCSYMGIKGNTLAWNRSTESFGKFVSRQKKWVGIGVFLFLLFAVVQFISIYYILS